jgi:hypothetical protein
MTMTTKTIEFNAIEFSTAHEAIQWEDASGRGRAVTLDGKNFVMEQDEVDRLEIAGVEFAYLFAHEMPDGQHRIITVPVN